MKYEILDSRTTTPLDTLELHVLARAYSAAWRVIHGAAPEGWHPLPALNASIDYGISATQAALSINTTRG
jgi:hypothetical protein